MLPPAILLTRGGAALDLTDGIPDEYPEAASSYEVTLEQRAARPRPPTPDLEPSVEPG